MKKEAKSLHPPVLTVGKKLTAFTIEKTTFISASVVMNMSYIRRFIFWIIRFFYRANTHNKILFDVARRKLMVRLKAKCNDCDYIVNLHVDNAFLSRKTVILHAYANTIKLYKDTLGLYHIPEGNVPSSTIFTTTRVLLGQLVIPLLLVFGMLFLISNKNEYYQQQALDQVDGHFEQVVWNYLKTSSFIESRNLKIYLLDTEASMSRILTNLPVNKIWAAYDPEVFLVDDEDTKAYILPSAKIVIYRGLLRKIRSKNELAFLLSYLLAHLENSNHIKNLGSDLVDPYMFINMLGDNSFLAKWIVRFTPFYYVSYTKEQELEAIKVGLETTQAMYSGIGSRVDYLNIFNHTDLGLSKGIAQESLKELVDSYPESKLVSLDFILDEPTIQQAVVQLTKTTEETKSFDDIINDFNRQYVEMLNKYLDSMKFLPGLTNPRNLATEAQLNYNLELIKYGNNVVTYYTKFEDDLVNKYNKLIGDELNKIQERDKKTLYNSLWIRQLNQLQAVTKFYFDRDKLLLKSFLGEVNFLKKRVGRYYLKEDVLIFSSPNDQANYNNLMERIRSEMNQKPPK